MKKQKAKQKKSKTKKRKVEVKAINNTKAVIFDFDGVLVDSLPLVFRVYEIICKELGVEFTDDIYKRDFFETDYKLTLAKLGVVDDEGIRKAEDIFVNFMTKNRKEIKLIPGITPLLNNLMKNYKLGLVSNNRKEIIDETLRELDLEKFFDAVIGHELGTLKPDPGQILHCLKQLEIKPEEAVYIGDMEGDIEAAKRANVRKAVGVTYGYHSKHKLSKADIMVNQPKDIAKAVKE